MNHMAGKKRLMVVKLDLAKAYEKMEWSFVHDSLERLQFPQHIIDVIHACMSTATFRINWQGRTSQQFTSSRGLRQGDPMSLLLFVVALERLSDCIQDTVNDGTWIPLKFGRGGPSILHLLFTDDILLVLEASMANAHKILSVLEAFAQCSGQTINGAKSCDVFSSNTPNVVADSIIRSLWASLPLKILGAIWVFLSSWGGKAKLIILSL